MSEWNTISGDSSLDSYTGSIDTSYNNFGLGDAAGISGDSSLNGYLQDFSNASTWLSQFDSGGALALGSAYGEIAGITTQYGDNSAVSLIQSLNTAFQEAPSAKPSQADAARTESDSEPESIVGKENISEMLKSGADKVTDGVKEVGTKIKGAYNELDPEGKKFVWSAALGAMLSYMKKDSAAANEKSAEAQMINANANAALSNEKIAASQRSASALGQANQTIRKPVTQYKPGILQNVMTRWS